MSVNITFLGGADTVTGSKFLVQHEGQSLLVDCGLFQGYKQLRLRNWRPLPVVPGQIHAVILTHAHLDHSGYLPLLAREGFRGRVHATAGTRDLCAILLPDSGHIQEEDAAFANRHGFSKHSAGPAAVHAPRRAGLPEADPRRAVQPSLPADAAAGTPPFHPPGTSWARPACCWKWPGTASCSRATWAAPTTC
jgi:glyoxylase-like metal-dependent hydrolase (beta-lactamase superfamily II)